MEVRINKYVNYKESVYKDNEDIMRMIKHAQDIVKEIEDEDCDIYDYFGESEVRYVIDSNKELLGGYLTIEYGGPTTIVDTYNNVLRVEWWGDSVICELDNDTCTEINDYLEMLYTC